MTTPTTTTEHTVTADADRVLAGLTPAQRLLAAHTALPAAVDTGLVRLMRDNFLLDGPLEEQLPVTAESEAAMARLLLSPLFSPVDDDLYEMHVAARAVLLAELERIDGGARLIEVAVLLERYVVERAQWTTELQWAQKISARVVTDPADVQQFLAAGAAQGAGHGLDGRWYAAVRARVEQQQVASATLQQEVADSPAGDDADLVALLVRTYPTPADVERFLSGSGQADRIGSSGPLPLIMAAVVADARARGTLADIVDTVWSAADDDGRDVLSPVAMQVGDPVAILRSPRVSRATAFRAVSTGLWVTAAHVVGDDPTGWTIVERGRDEGRSAQLVGIDVIRDVALLQSDGPPGRVLAFSDDPGPDVGDRVRATVVHPNARVDTSLTVVGRTEYGVELDADLGPGSSGAPVVDDDGRVVGMLAATVTGGRGYAVAGADIQAALAGQLDQRRYPNRWLQPVDGRLFLQLADAEFAQGRLDRSEAFRGVALEIAVRHGDDELLAQARAVRSSSEPRQPVPAELLEFAARFEEVDTINRRADRLSRREAQLIRLRNDATRHRGDPEWHAAVPVLLGADRPAEQLVGIALLQVEPDAARLGELAAFVNPAAHPSHLGFEAVVALRNAAETLSDGHLGELTAALDTATAFLRGQDSTDRARVLQQLRQRVDDRARRRITSDWKVWRDRSELRVRFLGGSAEQQAAVSALADEWTAGSGISFRFLPTDSAEHAEIRIAITTGEMSWSYLGTTALSVPAEQPTMSVDVVLPLTGRRRGQVLKEFGHALGLVSEHQQPHADLPWDHAAVLATFTRPPNNWTPEMVEQQFLARYEFPTPPEYRPFDPKSVMLHEFAPELFLDGSGTRSNNVVSDSDRAFVARLYPPPAGASVNPSVPTSDQQEPAVPRLTGAQRKALIDALTAAYPTYDGLDYMLATELDRRLADYAPPGRLPIVVHTLIRSAEAQGWTDELVTGALLGNPGDPTLNELLASGLLDRSTAVHRALVDPTDRGVQALLPEAVILDGAGPELERIVRSAAGFPDVASYASALLEQAARVCSISVPTTTGWSAATGFLVGPDLVLTNYHVVRDMIDGRASPAGIECVFDHRITPQGTVDHGVRYPLADHWLVASSPMSAVDEEAEPVELPGEDELDYALIRLSGEPGRTRNAGGHERGWLDVLADPPPLSPGLPLLILQYPTGHPLKMAVDAEGVLAVNANRTRVRYRATTVYGSSGSPCFTSDLRLVALHHSTQPGRTGSEGIPIATIAAHLRDTGHAAALGGH